MGFVKSSHPADGTTAKEAVVLMLAARTYRASSREQEITSSRRLPRPYCPMVHAGRRRDRPCLSHSPLRTGSRAFVAVMMMSEPRTALSASVCNCTISSAKRLACSGSNSRPSPLVATGHDGWLQGEPSPARRCQAGPTSRPSAAAGRFCHSKIEQKLRLSHAPLRTGSRAFVAVTIMSASRTALSASVAIAPLASAKRLACSASQLQTLTSCIGRTCRMASR